MLLRRARFLAPRLALRSPLGAAAAPRFFSEQKQVATNDAEDVEELDDRYKKFDYEIMNRVLNDADERYFDVTSFKGRHFHKPVYKGTGFNLQDRLKEQNIAHNSEALAAAHRDKQVAKIYRLLPDGFTVDRRMRTKVESAQNIYTESVMVVAGNGKGVISWGYGRAADPERAKERAVLDMRNNLLYIPMFEGRTLFSACRGKHQGAVVDFYPTKRGHGSTCSPFMYEFLELCGLEDVIVKSRGTTAPMNVIKACFDALKDQVSLRSHSINLGRKLYTMFEPGIVRPERPSQRDMWVQQQKISDIVKNAHNMWSTRLDVAADAAAQLAITSRQIAQGIQNPNPADPPNIRDDWTSLEYKAIHKEVEEGGFKLPEPFDPPVPDKMDEMADDGIEIDSVGRTAKEHFYLPQPKPHQLRATNVKKHGHARSKRDQ